MFKANHSCYGSDLNRLGVTHFHTCPYMSLLNGELFEGPFPPNHWIISVTRMITYLWTTHSANGPWDKRLKLIFPTKHVIPETLKSSHWLRLLLQNPTNQGSAGVSSKGYFGKITETQLSIPYTEKDRNLGIVINLRPTKRNRGPKLLPHFSWASLPLKAWKTYIEYIYIIYIYIC